MAAEEGSSSASLQHTPTWAADVVFILFISAGLLLAGSTEALAGWLRRRGKKSWSDAVDRIKEELMILGFLSMLLAVFQRPISKICIPPRVANTMRPCRPQSKEHHERVLFTEENRPSWGTEDWRRKLAGQAGALDHCASKGMVSLVSEKGIHQLHILIFILAVIHIIFSVITMILGRAKMSRWKAWEKETQTLEYQVANDPRRFRLIRETTYAKRHISAWTENFFVRWVTCFFRQFYNSVPKVDYLTLRHGFISAHFPQLRVFNFQKYIKRSLEYDFKSVLRVSPSMWFLIVIFLLIDVYGWYAYFWLSFLPLVAVLAAGAKLQVVVAEMALLLGDYAVMVTGTPRVQPNDELFWFGRPKLILFLIHFSLFQNAFQLSFFLWVWYEYGLGSCFHQKSGMTAARILIIVVVQVMCSYITLPLYALVTQMGSSFNKTMIDEKTAQALVGWHEDVRRKTRKQRKQRHPQQEVTVSTQPGAAAVAG